MVRVTNILWLHKIREQESILEISNWARIRDSQIARLAYRLGRGVQSQIGTITRHQFSDTTKGASMIDQKWQLAQRLIEARKAKEEADIKYNLLDEMLSYIQTERTLAGQAKAKASDNVIDIKQELSDHDSR